MAYHLLTGSTGLLGTYLLRDLLLSGQRLAVLVRPSKYQSARQRIETILRRWELESGRILPRPVVLDSDLTHIDLGLDGQSIRWIEQNCRSVIHNAASLVFRGDEVEGEPFLSNVEGTRHVLELCRCTGIRHFHHVSTAYVCGLREGTILERDVDVGQTPGNVYEKSKLQAELMVRSAGHLDSATVYRPSIIVGDSKTSYTSTFHGFYAPLKLAHTMASKVAVGTTGGGMLTSALGLKGNDHKNFVPVDWVSAVISHIHGRREHHGKTYHLTSPRPTPIGAMASVLQEAVEETADMASASDDWAADSVWFEKTFRDQLAIYGAYWRDDPKFDCTNTLIAAPHLPCPTLDRAALLRLAKFAIDSNFGRQRRSKDVPEFDVHSHLGPLVEARYTVPDESETPFHYLGLQVNGPGGGQWELMLDRGQIIAADDGVSTRSTAVFHLNSKTFHQLAIGKMTVRQAVRKGHVRIVGNGMPFDHLEAVLQTTALMGAEPTAKM